MRVVIKTTAQQESLLRDDEIRKALSEAAYIASISREIDTPRRTRLGEQAIEQLTPRQALELYFSTTNMPQDRVATLLKYARELIGDSVDVRRDPGTDRLGSGASRMADHVQANLTVQEAYNRAKSALEGGAPDRAAAIAQHILRYYPRYFDAYRLLGEAYLERGQADEAFRLFTHVLQVDPQNVLAHIGRAIIAEERGEIDAAIDEYERAFEVDPSIPELRGELLRLYKERDGSAGASIRTTPSGLAYVHLRSGLRDAAISEFSTAAQMRPDRWDLEVALAEALWRNEQLDETAAIAGDILASHPLCAKCNWLLGYIHWTSGRTESGRQYLLDAVALDPTYAIAGRLWETTPWPLDRNLTRPQPALIPGWSGETLEAANLALEAEHKPQDAAGARSKTSTRPLDPQRITQKFEAMPPLPPEPAPALAAPAAPADVAPAEEMAPAPLDLDWFDEWAAEAAAPAPVETPAPPPAAAAEIAPPVAPEALPTPPETFVPGLLAATAAPPTDSAATEAAAPPPAAEASPVVDDLTPPAPAPPGGGDRAGGAGHRSRGRRPPLLAGQHAGDRRAGRGNPPGDRRSG